MKKGILVVHLSLLALVFGAPVDIKQDSKRREATPETLELEETLKTLAGENKKFFPGPGLQPVPQVDGLEDHPEDDLVASLPGRTEDQDNNDQESEQEQEDEGESPVLEGGERPMQEDVEKDSEGESMEEGNGNEEEDLDQLKQIQEDQSDEQEIPPELLQQPYAADTEQNEPVDADTPAEYDGVPRYLPQGTYDGQQQSLDDGYAGYQYGQDYPAYGDIGGAGSNEDYLVQDVMDLMDKHPELWERLMLAKNMNLMEDGGPQYEDFYDQSQMQRLPEVTQQRELQSDVPGIPGYGMQEAPNGLYNDEEDLQNLQRAEKLQDFYGDSSAHVVAKKKGYGPIVEYPSVYQNDVIQRQQQSVEGSGDSDMPFGRNVADENAQRQFSQEVEAENKVPIYKIPVM